MFFKKFHLLLHIQANRGLQACGAYSAVLWAAMGWTSLTGQMATSVVTMAWHEPKWNSSSLATPLMVSLWSPVSISHTSAIISSFLLIEEHPVSSSLCMDVHPSLKQQKHLETCIWPVASFEEEGLILISISSHFLELVQNLINVHYILLYITNSINHCIVFNNLMLLRHKSLTVL